MAPRPLALVSKQSTRSATIAHFGKLGALAVAYVCLGKLVLAISPSGFGASVWPPAGLSLAALLIGGYRLWPGVGP
jgi:integral membrane sensor domain MASE1